jgi:hypothetical protein
MFLALEVKMSSMPWSLFLRLRTVATVAVVCTTVLTITHIVRANAPKAAPTMRLTQLECRWSPPLTRKARFDAYQA